MLKNIIFLFGFSAFVTIFWIATTIYHNSATSKISSNNLKKIEPINSSFDNATIQILNTRTTVPVDLSENLNIVDENSIETEPEITSSPESIEQTEPEITPELTPTP